MAEALKEKFNSAAIQHLAATISANCSEFDRLGFVNSAEADLEALELKARSNLIKKALFKHMPSDVSRTLDVMHASLGAKPSGDSIIFDSQPLGISGWMIMPVADYIADLTVYQHPNYFDAGLEFMKSSTSRFSAEFAIREFLLQRPEHTLSMLQQWLTDQDTHVRRLISEGTRPYLPWGMNLKLFVQKPQLILPLLEQLKDDPSEYVRRSVANNLNDIAKDHPELVSELANKWWEPTNDNRQKLLRHACRTLIKQGHQATLLCFGFKPVLSNELSIKFSVDKHLNIGQSLNFTCSIRNKTEHARKLLVDYKVHHVKANGSLSPKVFKWKSLELPLNASIELNKKHSFKPVTTRKYYSGLHLVELQINGLIVAGSSFMLSI